MRLTIRFRAARPDRLHRRDGLSAQHRRGLLVRPRCHAAAPRSRSRTRFLDRRGQSGRGGPSPGRSRGHPCHRPGSRHTALSGPCRRGRGAVADCAGNPEQDPGGDGDGRARSSRHRRPSRASAPNPGANCSSRTTLRRWRGASPKCSTGGIRRSGAMREARWRRDTIGRRRSPPLIRSGNRSRWPLIPMPPPFRSPGFPRDRQHATRDHLAARTQGHEHRPHARARGIGPAVPR